MRLTTGGVNLKRRRAEVTGNNIGVALENNKYRSN